MGPSPQKFRSSTRFCSAINLTDGLGMPLSEKIRRADMAEGNPGVTSAGIVRSFLECFLMFRANYAMATLWLQDAKP